MQTNYSDMSYWRLQYAMLVMDFSENSVIGELQYASLVIGLTECYSTLG